MKRLKANHLRLEVLEHREVPAATAILSGGNLIVRTDNLANNVSITQTVGSQLKVENNGKVVGTFNVPGNLSITTGNSSDTVVLALLASPGFGGSVTVSTGNGNDTVDVGGLIKGSLNVSTGLGNDLATSNGIDLTVRGSYLYTDASGKNSFDMNDRNYTIGANFVVRGAASFTMGESNTLTVSGMTTIGGSTSPINPLSVLLDGANVVSGGAFQIFGDSGNDVVSVTSALNLGGSMSLFMGQGDNTFVLTPLAGGSGVNGDLSFTGGTGVDVVVFGSDSSVGGRTSATLGHGINTFVDTATSEYAGDLSITGGDGTNTVVASGIINGNFNNTFGNGDGNTTVFTGTLGGTFNYRLGNGSLGTLTLAPAIASFIQINATFGSGDSTFNLGPNVMLGGIVRGTGGVYTFNQGTAILGPNLQFINYP